MGFGVPRLHGIHNVDGVRWPDRFSLHSRSPAPGAPGSHFFYTAAEFRHVGVERGVLAAMADHHGAAVTALVPLKVTRPSPDALIGVPIAAA